MLAKAEQSQLSWGFSGLLLHLSKENRTLTCRVLFIHSCENFSTCNQTQNVITILLLWTKGVGTNLERSHQRQVVRRNWDASAPDQHHFRICSDRRSR